jgi:hypothetical protein
VINEHLKFQKFDFNLPVPPIELITLLEDVNVVNQDTLEDMLYERSSEIYQMNTSSSGSNVSGSGNSMSAEKKKFSFASLM